MRGRNADDVEDDAPLQKAQRRPPPPKGPPPKGRPTPRKAPAEHSRQTARGSETSSSRRSSADSERGEVRRPHKDTDSRRGNRRDDSSRERSASPSQAGDRRRSPRRGDGSGDEEKDMEQPRQTPRREKVSTDFPRRGEHHEASRLKKERAEGAAGPESGRGERRRRDQSDGDPSPSRREEEDADEREEYGRSQAAPVSVRLNGRPVAVGSVRNSPKDIGGTDSDGVGTPRSAQESSRSSRSSGSSRKGEEDGRPGMRHRTRITDLGSPAVRTPRRDDTAYERCELEFSESSESSSNDSLGLDGSAAFGGGGSRSLRDNKGRTGDARAVAPGTTRPGRPKSRFYGDGGAGSDGSVENQRPYLQVNDGDLKKIFERERSSAAADALLSTMPLTPTAVRADVDGNYRGNSSRGSDGDWSRRGSSSSAIADPRDLRFVGHPLMTAPPPTAPRGQFVQCVILRERGGLHRLAPCYRMYFQERDRLVMVAQKHARSRTSNYRIFDMQRPGAAAGSGPGGDVVLRKKGGNFLGKVRANSKRDELVVLTNDADHEEMAAILFERPGIMDQVRDGSQPRKFSVSLPTPGPRGEPLTRRGTHFDPEESLLEKLKARSSPHDGLMVLRTKDPSFENGNYRLNFKGRVTVPSVKNFQLVAAPAGGDDAAQGATAGAANNINSEVLCQFGKVGEDRFHLDFRWPVNAFQAFAISLAQFNFG